MGGLTPAVGELIGPGGDFSWMGQLNVKEPYPVLLPVHGTNQNPYSAFTLFIISEIILGFVGFYLGGSLENDSFRLQKWNWNEATAVAAAGGGVDGAFIPFAFYYAVEAIGFEPTFLIAVGGGYLAAAAENRNWNIKRWNISSPATINAAFVGVQNSYWLVDALTYIRSFVQKNDMQGMMMMMFIIASYLSGAIVAGYYIHRDFGFNFSEWDATSPVFWYGALQGYSGYRSGGRLPIGFAEIAMDFADAKRKSFGASDDRDAIEMFIRNVFLNKKWNILGALWLGWVSASVENQSFNPKRWDFSRFGTKLALANGIVFGKDLDLVFMDVTRYFLGDKNGVMGDNNGGVNTTPTRNKVIRPQLAG